tara:strand:+ start:2309 stop:2692 length:384 start_codon:yes stop_codon:yes gene_type:complete
MDFMEINLLGQAINDTWGKSSTTKSHTMSTKATLAGSDLTVKYMVVINLGSVQEAEQAKQKNKEDGFKVIDQYITELKKNFKELSGDSTLKLKQKNDNDSLEIISMSPHNPRKTAYYRLNVVFDAQV